jgi:predicted  nucleic acid-binding Zn-ribbon protein
MRAKCGSLFFLYIKQPEDVRQFDAVQQELKHQETTLENEIKKEIEKRKAVKRKVARKEKKKIKKERVVRKPEKPIPKAEPKIKEPAVEPPMPTKRDVVKIGGTKFAVEDMFGIETVRVPREGVYEINIDALMKKRPVIVLERGNVYFIHLPSAFEAKEK